MADVKAMALRADFDFDQPNPVGTPTRVRVTNDDGVTERWACGHGPITANGGDADTVEAKILAAAAPLPATPPAGTTPGRIVGGDGQWRWIVARTAGGGSDVPGASCTPDPEHPVQQFAVWIRLKSDGTYVARSRLFEGKCDCDTECGQVDAGSGSGSGMDCGSGSDSAQVAQTGAGAAVALAPAKMGVNVAGVADPKGSALNRVWELILSDTTGPTGVWSGGGDGASAPRVELTCSGPPSPTWRLTLRHAGFRAEYTASAASWHALAPITLTAADADLPQTLTLTPL